MADKVVFQIPTYSSVEESKNKFKATLPGGIGQINAGWRHMSRLAYHAFTHCNDYGETFCIARLITIVLNKTNDLVLAHAFKKAAADCCGVTIRKDNSIKGNLQYYKATRKEDLWEKIKNSDSQTAMAKLATAFDSENKDRICGLGYFAARGLPQQQQQNKPRNLTILLDKAKELSNNDPVLKGKYEICENQVELLEKQLSAMVRKSKGVTE